MAVVFNSTSDVMLQTFDNLDTPAFIIDANQKIVAVNTTANRIFRYASADIIGRDISELITQTSGEGGKANSTFTAGLQTDGIHNESLCKKKNGEFFIARVSVVATRLTINGSS